MLAANAHRASGESFTRPYIIRGVTGVRVGILGLAYPNTPLASAHKNVEQVRFREAVDE